MSEFSSLVQNAFDFLSRSIDEIEESPKYAVIDFCAGLELVLKARLLAEHWTLLLADPARADRAGFERGDFKSVSIEDAATRIEATLGERINPKARQVFLKLRDHRNRLVHFFHPELSGQVAPETIQRTLAELSLGWYYLSDLLRVDWKKVFANHSQEIEDLQNDLDAKGHILRGRFESLKEAIEAQSKAGTEFRRCLVCRFGAARVKAITDSLINVSCLVCRDEREAIRLDCEQCGGVILFEDLSGSCEDDSCPVVLKVEDITKRLASWDEMDRFDLPATCCVCEHVPASVVRDGDAYLCVVCLEMHDSVGNCEYCSTGMTGSTEDTYLFGCVMCDGKIENERD